MHRNALAGTRERYLCASNQSVLSRRRTIGQFRGQQRRPTIKSARYQLPQPTNVYPLIRSVVRSLTHSRGAANTPDCTPSVFKQPRTVSLSSRRYPSPPRPIPRFLPCLMGLQRTWGMREKRERDSERRGTSSGVKRYVLAIFQLSKISLV